MQFFFFLERIYAPFLVLHLGDRCLAGAWADCHSWLWGVHSWLCNLKKSILWKQKKKERKRGGNVNTFSRFTVTYFSHSSIYFLYLFFYQKKKKDHIVQSSAFVFGIFLKWLIYTQFYLATECRWRCCGHNDAENGIALVGICVFVEMSCFVSMSRCAFSIASHASPLLIFVKVNSVHVLPYKSSGASKGATQSVLLNSLSVICHRKGLKIEILSSTVKRLPS